MAKQRIVKKLVRVQENPVTHKLERTELDAVQLAYERCIQAVDGALCQLPTTGTDRWHSLIEEARALLGYLETGQAPEVIEPLATIAREYRKIDPLHQPRLTAKLRERFRVMLPHTEHTEESH